MTPAPEPEAAARRAVWLRAHAAPPGGRRPRPKLCRPRGRCAAGRCRLALLPHVKSDFARGSQASDLERTGLARSRCHEVRKGGRLSRAPICDFAKFCSFKQAPRSVRQSAATRGVLRNKSRLNKKTFLREKGAVCSEPNRHRPRLLRRLLRSSPWTKPRTPALATPVTAVLRRGRGGCHARHRSARDSPTSPVRSSLCTHWGWFQDTDPPGHPNPRTLKSLP